MWFGIAVVFGVLYFIYLVQMNLTRCSSEHPRYGRCTKGPVHHGSPHSGWGRGSWW